MFIKLCSIKLLNKIETSTSWQLLPHSLAIMSVVIQSIPYLLVKHCGLTFNLLLNMLIITTIFCCLLVL